MTTDRKPNQFTKTGNSALNPSKNIHLSLKTQNLTIPLLFYRSNRPIWGKILQRSTIYKLGTAYLQFLFLLFPPVFRQMNDIWHTNHPKVKKSPRLSLNLCVAFPFLFLSLSTATHPSMELSSYHPPQSPFSHFPFLFLLFRASLSLSLSLSQKSLFRYFIYAPLKI